LGQESTIDGGEDGPTTWLWDEGGYANHDTQNQPAATATMYLDQLALLTNKTSQVSHMFHNF